MSRADDAHNKAFHERLARIHGKTQPEPPATPEKSELTEVSSQSAGSRHWAMRALYDLLMSPLGLIAGITAVLGGRMVAATLFGPDGVYPIVLNPPVAFMGIELALALIFMVLAMLVLRLSGGLRRAAVFVGFMVAIVAEQALIDQMPGALSVHYPIDMIRDAIITL